MFDRLNRQNFWLGIRLDSSDSPWKRLDGSVVPERFLFSERNDPIDGARRETALMCSTIPGIGLQYLQDYLPNASYHSACDRRDSN